MILRWWRNRTGRPLYHPQIHQKIIWMLSNFWIKELLNAGEEYQAPRKAACSLQKEIGQNIKNKKRDKRVRNGDHPRKGVITEEKFPNTRKPSHSWVCGEFWNLRGQHNRESWKKNKKPPNMHLTATPSREVAQKFASTTMKWGLNREDPLSIRSIRRHT